MPRKNNWGSVKTPPTRQRQQRQATQLGELDTTPTRPDASPSLPSKRNPERGGKQQSFPDNIDSDIFDDGLEDGDLVQLADTQAVSETVVAKEFPWSETGSGARRSSSVSTEGPPRGPYSYFGVGNVFSSPNSGSDALPDTVPLPRDVVHAPLLEDQRQTPMIVDFSETATTILRSSPMTGSRHSKSLGTSSHRDFGDRVWVDDSVCQIPSQPALIDNNKPIAVQINEDDIPVPVEQFGNACALLESARETVVGVDQVESAAQCSNTPRCAVVNPANHFMSLDGEADRLDPDQGAALETIHVAGKGKKQKKKRKQRPKSPLRFDNDTRVVRDVVKKPVRKKNCRNSALKDAKPSSSPLENIVQQAEVAEPSPRDTLVEVAECLPTTRHESPPVDTKATMHENGHPPNNLEDSFRDDPADMPSNRQEVQIIEISEEIVAESCLESPTSSGVKTRMSESNSPSTPPTTSTEIHDHEAKVCVVATRESNRRENCTASLQTEEVEDDEGVEAHSPVQQHSVPGSSGLVCLDKLRTVHDQHAKRSNPPKSAADGKLHLAAARPSRHISISGQGSPIRISHCEENAANSIPTEFSASEVWSSTGHTDCLKRPILNAAQHESTRSNKNMQQDSTFSKALGIEPLKALSTLALGNHHGSRRSIFSELKKEHANRRIVKGQTKTELSGPADLGRQRLRELIDVSQKTL